MSTTHSLTEHELLDQSLQALAVSVGQCTCPDRWHLLWAAIKATGLMRGMHHQQAFLAELLPRYLKPGPRVLIGGAADTGSLDVLSAALADPGAHYTVLDLCPAPLQMVRTRATEHGLSVDTVSTALDQLRTDRPWDLVFVHYTLSFLNRDERLRFMRHMRQDLAAGGVVVCAVREKQPPAETPEDLADQQAQRASDWARQAMPGFERVCADRPDLLEPVRRWAPAYALARMVREDSMATFRTVADEFASCGFVLLESHRNPGRPVARPGDLSPPNSITDWIGVFAPAAAG